jgi:hypothetical protein
MFHYALAVVLFGAADMPLVGEIVIDNNVTIRAHFILDRLEFASCQPIAFASLPASKERLAMVGIDAMIIVETTGDPRCRFLNVRIAVMETPWASVAFNLDTTFTFIPSRP